MLRRHKRIQFPGAILFVTTVTAVRGRWFVKLSLCRAVLETFETCRASLGVSCMGYVLMPDHLHILVQQNEEEDQVSEMMARFKRKTAFKCRPDWYPAGPLWNRRFDAVPVPGNRAVHTKLNYMHENPVKGGLSSVPDAYPWSSARDYCDIQNGIVSVARELVTFS
jgi:putative transposase